MSYLDDVEKELRQMLGDFGEEEDKEANDWAEDVVKFVRITLLESYKNGAQAARRQSPKLINC